MTTHRSPGIGAWLLILALAAFGAACSNEDEPTDVDCPTGEVACGEVCVDVESDAANCGGCGKACAEGEVCRDGVCSASCGAEETSCDGECVDLDRDAANCGECGHACGEGESCDAGECVPGSGCEDGELRCDGVCTDTDSDASNCGACGESCDEGFICSEGSCACPQGYLECDGACIEEDVLNCGGCGTVCETIDSASAPVCKDGLCRYECLEGFTTCSEDGTTVCETDTRDSDDHCGACGFACAERDNVESAGCYDSVCHVAQCQENYGDCDGDGNNGCEVSFLADVENCGGCGYSCHGLANNLAAPSCDDGACALQCAAGYDSCDNNYLTGCETHIDSDSQNCGECGNVCQGFDVCVDGKCVDTGWVEYPQWPMPADIPEASNYQVDGEKGIVTDLTTGLIWELQDPNTTDYFFDLEYCENSTLGDFDDWRLPTTMELITILDYSGVNPAIASVFDGARKDSYFTSTVAVWDPEWEAWVVDFRNGTTGGMTDLDEIKASVRCVRGGAPKAGERFFAKSETVVDTYTDLEWERSSASNISRTYASSRERCENLTLGGHSDWRLPGIKELATLLDLRDEELAMNPALFGGTGTTEGNRYYWSVRERDGTGNAYAIHVGSGHIQLRPKQNTQLSRCVRDADLSSED